MSDKTGARSDGESPGRRPQYHHDAEQGETRYPPETDETGAERDPHSALNRSVDAPEVEEDELESGE